MQLQAIRLDSRESTGRPRQHQNGMPILRNLPLTSYTLAITLRCVIIVTMVAQ
jgi:hypothetical protein